VGNAVNPVRLKMTVFPEKAQVEAEAAKAMELDRALVCQIHWDPTKALEVGPEPQLLVSQTR
jgi:hypothetical protein